MSAGLTWVFWWFSGGFLGFLGFSGGFLGVSWGFSGGFPGGLDGFFLGLLGFGFPVCGWFLVWGFVYTLGFVLLLLQVFV